ncbi:hypothetical protein FN976_01090 [Caenimonas sedimenti]|uniref:Uncharacterized protein n=1 Tax=Caenimonas sedimenti TaxID=2596921 RepID=A0A562ZWA2_9BURK|nr:hypothetical protein [Caenimonas sedimenti]TWO72870.1 hypothetical protein FN976_01090 [Caenimonas sedimenti]
MTATPNPSDTGNDDASGEPVGNRGDGNAAPATGLDTRNGDRGDASGRNLEQMEQARGKPGDGEGPAR